MFGRALAFSLLLLLIAFPVAAQSGSDWDAALSPVGGPSTVPMAMELLGSLFRQFGPLLNFVLIAGAAVGVFRKITAG